jgi:hypothetical protein
MNTLPMRSPVYVHRTPRAISLSPRAPRRSREASVAQALSMWSRAHAAHTRRSEPDPERTLPMRIPMCAFDVSKG